MPRSICLSPPQLAMAEPCFASGHLHCYREDLRAVTINVGFQSAFNCSALATANSTFQYGIKASGAQARPCAQNSQNYYTHQMSNFSSKIREKAHLITEWSFSSPIMHSRHGPGCRRNHDTLLAKSPLKLDRLSEDTLGQSNCQKQTQRDEAARTVSSHIIEVTSQTFCLPIAA